MFDAAYARQASLRTLVFESDADSASALQIMLGHFDNVEIVGAAQTGDQALHMIEALSPDLVLLSVQMPNMNGIEIANAVKNTVAPPSVIFISASQDAAFDAFQAAATDYLLTPVRQERLSVAIERASRNRAPEPQAPATEARFWVQRRNARICISASEIEFIEAQGDYALMHTSESNYMIHKTLKQLSRQLDPAQFLRIHRSTVVRRDRIKALVHRTANHWAVDLGNGCLHAIGKTFLPEVKAFAAS
jgi:two-component system, LytTR family, response regulator AlgR